jgi:hypothetical protein
MRWRASGGPPTIWGAGAIADRDGAGEQLAAVLRTWPMRDIERDVRLSGPQPMIKNLLWDECKTVEIRFKGVAPIA